MSIDAFFLPVVLALGLVSSLQDFQVRRISNAWILISLIYAVAAHLFLLLSGNHQEQSLILTALINSLISILVAVYFWRQNWWGGGDAKLFVCYSTLIPLPHYSIVYFSYYFASFFLLILTFVPAALWTFGHAQFNLMRSGKSFYSDFRPSRAQFGEFVEMSLGFIAIFFLSNLMILTLNQQLPWVRDIPLIIWMLGIAFYQTVFRLFQKRLWLVAVAWVVGIVLVAGVPYFHQINISRVLIRSFASWILVFILRIHIFRTIDKYVALTQNNNMAFAGWMFLGVMMLWYSKDILMLVKHG